MEIIKCFGTIKEYHKKLGYDFVNMTEEEKMRHLRDFALGLNQEVAELVNSTPWKPWRPIEDQTLDLHNATREIVDCIFFLAGICEIFNIPPEEINAMFGTVMRNNNSRITKGYNKIIGGDIND